MGYTGSLTSAGAEAASRCLHRTDTGLRTSGSVGQCHWADTMLRRKPGETLEQLLGRLDIAIATAKATGARVDEINKSDSDVRYSYKA